MPISSCLSIIFFGLFLMLNSVAMSSNFPFWRTSEELTFLVVAQLCGGIALILIGFVSLSAGNFSLGG